MSGGNQQVSDLMNEVLDELNDQVYASILNKPMFIPSSKKFHDWFDQLEFNIMSIIEGDSLDKNLLSMCVTNNIYNQIVEEKDEYFKFVKMLCDWWMVVRYNADSKHYNLGVHEHKNDPGDSKNLIKLSINGNKKESFYINPSLIIHIFLLTYTKPISNVNRNNREKYDPRLLRIYCNSMITEKRYLDKNDPNTRFYEALLGGENITYYLSLLPSEDYYYYYCAKCGRNTNSEFVSTTLSVDTSTFNVPDKVLPKETLNQRIGRRIESEREYIDPVDTNFEELEETRMKINQNQIRFEKLHSDQTEILDEHLLEINKCNSIITSEIVELERKLTSLRQELDKGLAKAKSIEMIREKMADIDRLMNSLK